MFVDGFAGPGRYDSREEGSPLIALRALLDHPRFQKPQPGREIMFLLIESRKDRATALKKELEQFSADRSLPGMGKDCCQERRI